MASSSTSTTTEPTSPTSPSREGSLCPFKPATLWTDEKHSSHPSESAWEQVHAFHPRSSSSESRGPCPALNTLSNHGYLPRDGHNISAADFMAALEHPDTYNLSKPLAFVLAYGGFVLLHKAPWSQTISLHDLAQHGLIEHNASMTHKNAAEGDPFAPTEVDITLLNELLNDQEFLTLDDVAKRRTLLEEASKLDRLHGEIARGEWALVLDVFGKTHGGKVPTDFLRVWLQENRFPEGWKPTHQLGLLKTVAKSRAIRKKMSKYRSNTESVRNEPVVEKLGQELTTTPEEDEKARGEKSLN